MNDQELVRRFYEEVISGNEEEQLGNFIAEDCVLRLGEETFPMGVSGMREHLRATKNTYPGYTMKILRQYRQGETVISEFEMTGTHGGEWRGLRPTHKTLRFSGVDIDRVRGGKIVEHGGAVGTFETLLEAGLIEPARAYRSTEPNESAAFNKK